MRSHVYSHLVLHGKHQALCENATGSNQHRASVCLKHSLYQSPSVRILLFAEYCQRHRKKWMCAVCFIPRVSSCHILLPEEECFWWQQEKHRVTEKQEGLLKQDHMNDKIRPVASNRQITDLKIYYYYYFLNIFIRFFSVHIIHPVLWEMFKCIYIQFSIFNMRKLQLHS